ncbi:MULTISPECIES: GH25 family lysozyme [unclassified Streptomyces]|uniref:GH25 family lysozyme n=1 Tax=unclassified Streptomyces TaxID=2593676 RepID=UPI000363E038|nr:MULTISPECIES: GH25 family lysozyme [unclassified Streptomyces]MYQ80686.1 lysozyme [Streptomyces sp. SID4923]NEC07977.1 lysozyme [Streptomyces sp. SID7909]OKJ02604.1 lysozyme [Streptomyces sp. CB01249]
MITRKRLTAAGVLGTSAALLLGLMSGTASAAPRHDNPVPLGKGYMGVGYVQDSKDFKPDTRQLHLGAQPDAGLKANPEGIDVSSWQGGINWSSVRGAGIEFAWMKATEGLTYKDPTFSANYLNAYNAGVIRGAYHYARPDVSGGAAQADFFASNGGAWSRDNLTLPGVLDIEGTCYGYSQASMQQWILDFYNQYKARTGRDVVIYTSPSWWNTCTGGWSGMSARSPLWVANWTTGTPSIPSGFPFYTVWQYTSTGSVSGVSGNVDRDRFSGDRSRLLALANNTP